MVIFLHLHTGVEVDVGIPYGQISVFTYMLMLEVMWGIPNDNIPTLTYVLM